MNSRFFFFFLFLLYAVGGLSQTKFEEAVQELIEKPLYKNASVALKVVETDSGADLFSLNSDKLLVPASTMKLISSATAMEILGAHYRFKTGIAYRGKIGRNGELDGDLVLIGGADPALGSEYFQDHYMDFLQTWAKSVKDLGIKHIKGNLILDGSVYDTEQIPDTWIWGDIGNYYGVGPHAFSVYDNLFRITFSSPKKEDKLTRLTGIDPRIKGMTIDNEVRSANINYDNAYVFGGPLDKKRVIRGTIPKNRKAFTIKAAIHQPEEIVAHDFLSALNASGVFLSGNVVYEPLSKKGIETVYIQESPTLAEIAEVLNHESVNLFAEHFLKQLAVERNKRGARQDAIEIVKEFWDDKGISTEHFFMEDGSGLSHFNAVSPDFFVQFLQYMAKNQDFVNTLPNAGEGTLKSFDPQLLPGSTLQAKSGSMTRVRCYAGYLMTDSGKNLTFSFMFNHFSGSHSKLIEEIEMLLSKMKNTL